MPGSDNNGSTEFCIVKSVFYREVLNFSTRYLIMVNNVHFLQILFRRKEGSNFDNLHRGQSRGIKLSAGITIRGLGRQKHLLHGYVVRYIDQFYVKAGLFVRKVSTILQSFITLRQ